MLVHISHTHTQQNIISIVLRTICALCKTVQSFGGSVKCKQRECLRIWSCCWTSFLLRKFFLCRLTLLKTYIICMSFVKTHELDVRVHACVMHDLIFYRLHFWWNEFNTNAAKKKVNCYILGCWLWTESLSVTVKVAYSGTFQIKSLNKLIFIFLSLVYFLYSDLSLCCELIIHQSRAACICFVQLPCIIELTQKPELNNRCLERVQPLLIQLRWSFTCSYFCLACIKIAPGSSIVSLLS